MRQIQVIKRRFSVSADRAVTDFVGFHAVATVHVSRIQPVDAREQMLELIEDIRKKLLQQQGIDRQVS